ncbi:MAG: ABC transporter substrate-binding protein [candidate division KSB1 bacterium]|nr:ABC transporter substrate-binding protein [candidate division KSB1 bacterium]MDZ7335774.1 ABC transporter substrate-binding protein [candidate division KSB1 bacterium]MDZ7358649.1 ABC transporter substrate-binding protein [candidate division KSB1 bacterium]MDZ7400761.1 ABC transporter substrate-binding protein [candidate division KSB1 bacterium]
MKKTFFAFSLIVALLLLGIVLHKTIDRTSGQLATHETGQYERIVSLSPNITETLFALGMGDKLVGVTRFCNYPPEAKSLPKVGGYLDLNYEAIIRLRPDLVLLTDDFQQSKVFFSQLGIKYISVNNKTVSDIRSSIAYLGKILGTNSRAEEILKEIDTKISTIQHRTEALYRPNVMIVIERTMGTGAIEDVYIAGKNTFFDELIEMAGGKNAYQDGKITYPMVSAEGISHLNPAIIIDLIPQLKQTGLDSLKVVSDWSSLPDVEAVSKRQIYIISDDYAVIPGPRFYLFLELLARIIHPEIDW